MKNALENKPSELFEIDDETHYDPPPHSRSLRQSIVGWYLRNAIEHPYYGDEVLSIALEWLLEQYPGLFDQELENFLTSSELEVAENEELKFHRARRRRGLGPKGIGFAKLPRSHKVFDRIRDILSPYQDRPGAKEDLLHQNIQMFGNEVGMDETDRELLCLVVRCEHIRELDSFMDEMTNHFGSISTVIACALGIDKTAAHRLVMPASLLSKSGVLRFDPQSSSFAAGHDSALMVLSILKKCLLRPYKSIQEMHNDLIGPACHTKLSWVDFEHIGQEAEFTKKMLRGAVDQGVTGVNILLYGPPGTGKTEFAKSLAATSGLGIISIGELDLQGREASRRDRLSQLSLAQHLLQKSTSTVLLLDEMEDVVSGNAVGGIDSAKGRPNQGSLVYLHRILEESPIPVIWTTNHIDSVRPSILRRFTNAIEFKVPPAPTRARLWSNMLVEAEIEISTSEIQCLSREIEAPPGILNNAVVAAKCAGGKVDEVRHAARQLMKTMRGGHPIRPKPLESASFDRRLLSSDMDLDALTRSVSECETSSGISLCLYGAPGTGKTAYVRHLAETMNMDILQKRASDLISKWVGETEQAIAGAFEDARISGRFLVFDEADSLLRDRSGAERSWEATQVNEMLTWMEVHDLPFACTTNLIASLDSAALRRFTFKVGFDYLSRQQSRMAFCHYFGLEAPQRLDGMDNLTPGDFAVVKNKSRILKSDDDRELLMRMLLEESELKCGKKNPVGFINP